MKKENVNTMLDEYIGKKYSESKPEAPKKSVKSFFAGAIVAVLFIALAGGAFAILYAGTQQIISTVTTGTAPFQVSSTTVVTNLNADMVDGFHASSLQDLPTSWTCTIRTASSVDCGSNCQSFAGAVCTGSEKVISGGCAAVAGEFSTSAGAMVGGPTDYSIPSGQGWSCTSYTTGGRLDAYANCCA